MTFGQDKTQLAIEALCVGIGNVMLFSLVKKIFRNNLNMQLFASGVLFHLAAEYSGLNDYYVDYKIIERSSRDEGQEIILDTSRTKRCLETQSTGPEAFPLCSVLDY
jgi:hypothetical protein